MPNPLPAGAGALMVHQFAAAATAWVPVTTGVDPAPVISAALAVADSVTLVGYVRVADPNSLSAAVNLAAELRRWRRKWIVPGRVRARERVIVSDQPWWDLAAAARLAGPDLMVLGFEHDFTALGITAHDLFDNPPCDVIAVRGTVVERPRRVLVPVRGGPYAELALRLGLALKAEHLEVLQVRPASMSVDAPSRGLDHVLRQLHDIDRRIVVTDDAVSTIIEEAASADVVVLGATAQHGDETPAMGPVAGGLLRNHPGAVMVVRTRREMPSPPLDESVGNRAISILVDKWFAENTYEASEFEDLQALLAFKRARNLTVSLALPALNEEKTVGSVIQTLKSALMDQVPLLDEIVLVDSDSTDKTRDIAAAHGVPVHVHQQLLPEMGARKGKGEALWKSLLVTSGDIVVWIDTDIVNIHPRFVYGILGPLLMDREVQFVKGFYRRPLRVDGQLQVGGGGRVTELMARPLLNLFYPELSGVLQPLSGEYAGRRTALECMPFFSGYGVETGLLIDIFQRFGLEGIAQVNLLERVHHNQPLEALSKMSFAIAQAVVRKLETRYGHSFLEDVNRTMKLVRHQQGRYRLVVEDMAELERPPMIEVPAYTAARERALS